MIPELRRRFNASFSPGQYHAFLSHLHQRFGGVVPELARVQHTDGAEIGVFEDAHTDRTIVICALDNLGKGAAGQAVQNVNHVFGFAETAGLRLAGVLV